jgi:hypothetical protein
VAQRHLVGLVAAAREVDGSVEVRPAVLGRREVVGRVEPAALRLPFGDLRQAEPAGGRPVDRPAVEGVAEVDEAVAIEVDPRRAVVAVLR